MVVSCFLVVCGLQVKEGNLATAEGVSYLEAKHLLLLHYCVNIVFYLLLKAEGRAVREHPVIARLLELRAYLEKIRPIDKKLQYQMDKLLLAAQLQVSIPPVTIQACKCIAWQTIANATVLSQTDRATDRPFDNKLACMI